MGREKAREHEKNSEPRDEKGKTKRKRIKIKVPVSFRFVLHILVLYFELKRQTLFFHMASNLSQLQLYVFYLSVYIISINICRMEP